MSRLIALTGLVAATCLGSAPSLADDGHPNIYNFQGHSDGNMPRGSLLADTQGNLYGTTSFGGDLNNGAVFKVVPAADGVSPATSTTIYSFAGDADGSLPSAGLIADASGNLYGTTAMDGTGLWGTVFELSPPAAGQTTWTKTTLWNFGAAGDGRNPVGDMLLGPDGTLYGTTNWGGASNSGSVFALTPPAAVGQPWTETILWNFSGGADGSQPVAALSMDGAGVLYGTTKLGGASGAGTVFSLAPPAAGSSGWAETVIWNFTGGSDGAEPSGNLLLGGNGMLYGTTTFGGSNSVDCAQARFPFYGESQTLNAPALGAPYVPAGGDQCGIVFRLAPSSTPGAGGNLTAIYSFKGNKDGGNAFAGLLKMPDDSLIGFTTELGHTFYGTTFRLQPPAKGSNAGWTYTRPVSFNAQPEGLYALGTPVLGLAGRIYGSMELGGNTWEHVTYRGWGVVFSVDPLN